MQASLTIRRATNDDAAVLAPLVDQYWHFEGIEGFDAARVVASLHCLLSDPRLGCGWIATDGAAPVGYLLAVYVFSLEHLGLTAEIDEFFIRLEYRGRGIGSRLLAAAEAEFLAAGCTNASLQLARENDRGRAFYRSCGYAGRTGYELFEKPLSRSS